MSGNIICPYCKDPLFNDQKHDYYSCVSIGCITELSYFGLSIEDNFKYYCFPIFDLDLFITPNNGKYAIISDYVQGITKIVYNSFPDNTIQTLKFVEIDPYNFVGVVTHFKNLIDRTFKIKAFI